MPSEHSNTSTVLTIGVIGYGEAGSAFADGLAAEQNSVVHVYDNSFHSRTTAAGRTASDGLVVSASIEELTRHCSIILSTVVANAAVPVARMLSEHVTDKHLVVDLNSVSPVTKAEIEQIVTLHGADFVEGAIMTNIATRGHRTPLYVCGPGAVDFTTFASARGMNVDNLGVELGRASATKMFRSVVVKGLEALLLESLPAAARYGVADRVLAKIEEGYPGLDWTQLADKLLGRTAMHGARRSDEMFEAAATLESMNITPHMASAAARRILDSGTALSGAFVSTPRRYQDVLEHLDNAEGAADFPKGLHK